MDAYPLVRVDLMGKALAAFFETARKQNYRRGWSTKAEDRVFKVVSEENWLTQIAYLKRCHAIRNLTKNGVPASLRGSGVGVERGGEGADASTRWAFGSAGGLGPWASTPRRIIVPSPGWLSIESAPRWRRQIPWATVRPIPLRPGLVVKKGSVACLSTSGVIPLPESRTSRKTQLRSSAWVVKLIRPFPLGIASRAFWIR